MLIEINILSFQQLFTNNPKICSILIWFLVVLSLVQDPWSIFLDKDLSWLAWSIFPTAMLPPGNKKRRYFP